MLTLSCVTTPEEIRRLEDDILAVADVRGVDPLYRSRMLLVLDELLTNIRLHSYPDGPGKIRAEILPKVGEDDTLLHLILHDWGPPFNPLSDTPVPMLEADIEDRPVGGLGLYLVHNMLCGIRYERVRELVPFDERNQLVLSFPLCRRSRQPAAQPPP